MNRFVFLAILFFSFFATSCKSSTDSPVVPSGDTKLDISPFSFEIPIEGGTYSCSFRVVNPVSGTLLSVTSDDLEWVTDIVIEEQDSTISFTVLPNNTYIRRTANIEFSYGDIVSAEISLSQDAPIQLPFEFSNFQCTESTISVDITPVDTESVYICRAVSKDYMESFDVTADQESLEEYDFEYLTIMANSYGISVREYLSDMVLKGVATGYLIEELLPNSEYLIFCYHIDINTAKCLSDIVFQWVTTGNVEQSDRHFDFEHQNAGDQVHVTVTPENYQGYYYYGYYKTDEFYSYFGSDADFADVVVRSWNEKVHYQRNLYFIPVSDVLEQNCFQSEHTFNHSLDAQSEYIFYAFSVDNETAFASSDVTTYTIMTEDVTLSDMVIDLQVTNLGARGAIFHFTPDNDEESYVGHWITKSEWDSYGSNEQQRMSGLLNAYSFVPKSGYISYNVTDLTPATDYVMFAFGYESGFPTTSIFYKEFSTSADVIGESTITIQTDVYFDCAELSNYDPIFNEFSQYALFPLIATVEPESDNYYYLLTTPEDLASWTDDEIRMQLYERFRQYTLRDEYSILFNTEVVFVGVVMDTNGNLGPLCKQTIYLTREGASDPQDYFSGNYAPTPLGITHLK